MSNTNSSIESHAVPWHTPLWDKLDIKNIPTSTLISGEKFIYKKLFSFCLAQKILCQKSCACQSCQSCKLFKARTHPDLCMLEPSKTNSIGIEEVRRAIDFSIHTPDISSARVVLIFDAESMTLSASNALLKALEDPYSSVHFILCSSQSSLLLKTILSRCCFLAIRQPTEKMLEDFYALHHVTPHLSYKHWPRLVMQQSMNNDKHEDIDLLLENFLSNDLSLEQLLSTLESRGWDISNSLILEYIVRQSKEKIILGQDIEYLNKLAKALQDIEKDLQYLNLDKSIMFTNLLVGWKSLFSKGRI